MKGRKFYTKIILGKNKRKKTDLAIIAKSMNNKLLSFIASLNEMNNKGKS
jgi:hypothetical protein